jgi:uncharacterized delta-60 repeat protein
MKHKLLYFVFLLTSLTTFAQDGALDTSFNQGSGYNDYAYAIAIQPDGKIIIGGAFTAYNGTNINKIARLNTNGTLDTTFNVGTGANALVTNIVIQSDGKIIIVGFFTTYNSISCNRITRLNTDGTLDASFNSGGTGANNAIHTIAIQPDGKIIIGGSFTNYNGTSRNRIARLNDNGTLDTTFNIGTGTFATVHTTAIQSDGKIIIGGGFTTYNGTLINCIARLNTNGTLDSTFSSGLGAVTTIYTISIQSDGKIIIGGDFPTYNGTTTKNIARLNTNGTLDTAFNTGSGSNFVVYSATIQPDGKIIISGDFSSYNNTARSKIARLNTNGTLDTTFNPGTGADSRVIKTAIQSDGKIIIVGLFTSYDSTSRNYLARLSNPSLQTESFDISSKFSLYPNPAQNIVNIDLQELDNASVAVYDINGRQLFTQKLNTTTNAINIENLASGVYLFKVSSSQGTATTKVVKQ